MGLISSNNWNISWYTPSGIFLFKGYNRSHPYVQPRPLAMALWFSFRVVLYHPSPFERLDILKLSQFKRVRVEVAASSRKRLRMLANILKCSTYGPQQRTICERPALVRVLFLFFFVSCHCADIITRLEGDTCHIDV